MKAGAVGATLAALALLYGGAKMANDVPRGIRNHNPGNIRRTGTRWQGMASDQSADPEYIVFQSPFWGLRAMARILKTYRERYGLRTVRGIVTRWAPPNENDTESYVNSVAQALGVGPDDDLPGDTDTTARLVAAIVRHENGVQPYSPAMIRNAVEAAG